MDTMLLPTYPAWTWIDTPMGWMLVVTTRRGVVRTEFSAPDGSQLPREGDVLPAVTAALEVEPERDARGLSDLTSRMEAWFAGDRTDFGVDVDLSLSHGFMRRVCEAIQEIPFGETVSYGEVAAMVGSPLAARAVGTACKNVPVALFLPVHRVVRADGTTGESPDSPCHRRNLLMHERAVLGRGRSPWN
ncbi:methylated-DNA--[protein]-cysteine S-methyltransferase [Kocuria soli]|uniref:Methylated-DNA--[protein]-cysteine S-methyltransferase n=2 Tax=Kocuria soli TaxID=2485125 RepID=A0A3N3ZSG0_9MICC|nr:methylated-DNA--[protein]-cysteine S-methyltransferase [Kocuria soli]